MTLVQANLTAWNRSPRSKSILFDKGQVIQQVSSDPPPPPRRQPIQLLAKLFVSYIGQTKDMTHRF